MSLFPETDKAIMDVPPEDRLFRLPPPFCWLLWLFLPARWSYRLRPGSPSQVRMAQLEAEGKSPHIAWCSNMWGDPYVTMFVR